MKNLLRSALLLFIVTCVGQVSHAQDATHGLGLRAGSPYGITYKHYSGSKAFEGILYGWNGGLGITGLLEFQRETGAANLQWFYGVGAHIGTADDDHDDDDFELGADGIIGLEYFIPGAPISLGLDFKPEFNLVGNTGFDPAGALSIRYNW